VSDRALVGPEVIVRAIAGAPAGAVDVIADIDANGRISSADATRILRLRSVSPSRDPSAALSTLPRRGGTLHPSEETMIGKISVHVAIIGSLTALGCGQPAQPRDGGAPPSLKTFGVDERGEPSSAGEGQR
jgi:hypothetical protein